jgi:serine/threonine protein kinase
VSDEHGKEGPEELFESFVESGAKDFEAFLANYPQHEESLKELLERREEVARELEELLLNESFFRGRSTASDGDADGSWPGRSPGDIIGDFRLVSPLGRGGMGQVWEAEQVSMGRMVALKLLHTHLQMSDDDVRRFGREARAGGKLAHPGIVQE